MAPSDDSSTASSGGEDGGMVGATTQGSAQIAEINAANSNRTIPPKTAATTAPNPKEKREREREREKAKKEKKKRRAAEKERIKLEKEFDEFLALAKDDKAMAMSMFASLRGIYAKVEALTAGMAGVNVTLAQIASDVRCLPSSGRIPPIPTYDLSPTPPESADERLHICFTQDDWKERQQIYHKQQGTANGTTAAKKVKKNSMNGKARAKAKANGGDDDEEENGSDIDDDEDKHQLQNEHPIITDAEWHATFGFLIDAETLKYIGAEKLSEISAFIRSAFITMARLNKLGKSFKEQCGVDVKIILVNLLEATFPEIFAKCYGHWKALLTLQHVAGQIGLSSLIALHSTPALSSVAPSGAATPLAGTSTHPIVVADVNSKLSKFNKKDVAPTPRIKLEPNAPALPPLATHIDGGAASIPTKRRPDEDSRLKPKGESKKRKIAVFADNLSTPSSIPPSSSVHGTHRAPQSVPSHSGRHALVTPSTLAMGPPQSTSRHRPHPSPFTPANPQARYPTPLSGPTRISSLPVQSPLPAPSFEGPGYEDEAYADTNTNFNDYTMEDSFEDPSTGYYENDQGFEALTLIGEAQTQIDTETQDVDDPYDPDDIYEPEPSVAPITTPISIPPNRRPPSNHASAPTPVSGAFVDKPLQILHWSCNKATVT